MHVMVDLETMSSRHDASIVSMGACVFDARGVGKTFYRNIDLSSCQRLGLHIDANTVMWWLGQSEAARVSILVNRIELSEALLDFSRWITENSAGSDARVWGNGATFDNVILRNAHNVCGIKAPWSYRGDRCYRTMINMLPPAALQRTGVAHNALDDAVYQATALVETLNRANVALPE